jgi:hypothetical protein
MPFRWTPEGVQVFEEHDEEDVQDAELLRPVIFNKLLHGSLQLLWADQWAVPNKNLPMWMKTLAWVVYSPCALQVFEEHNKEDGQDAELFCLS